MGLVFHIPGGVHTMAITSDSALWAWDSNFAGLLGDVTTTDSSIPIRIMENVVSVSTGNAHTMAK